MSGVISNKRNTESKYVSVFADSRPDVDVTFRQELLSRPSDHFLVGVDNLTVSLNSLSMLLLEDGDVLRIGRIRKVAAGFVYQNNLDLATNLGAGRSPTVAHVYPDTLAIFTGKSNGQPFHNIQQFLQRLRQLAADVNSEMMQGLGYGNGEFVVGYVRSGDAHDTHLEFELRPDGRIEVIGSRAFWANYFIRIKKKKYQRVFEGRLADEFDDGRERILYIGCFPMGQGQRYEVATENAARVSFYGQREPAAGDTQNRSISNADLALLRAGVGGHQAQRYQKLRLLLGGNVWSTLDRRICLEMGCSLPVQNSPMIDHNQENPDFVLGRWMYNPRATQSLDTQGQDGRITHMCPSVIEYQNSTDRVCYHALMPQEKVQTVRLKMFMRVRAYDENSDTYSMDVVQCPTSPTDWWHARLHFVSKD